MMRTAAWWVSLLQPLRSFDGSDINTTLTNFANTLTTFVGGATILCIAVAGYYWMFSENRPERRSRAESALWAAAIGAMIVVLSSTIGWLISHDIVSTPNGVPPTPTPIIVR